MCCGCASACTTAAPIPWKRWARSSVLPGNGSARLRTRLSASCATPAVPRKSGISTANPFGKATPLLRKRRRGVAFAVRWDVPAIPSFPVLGQVVNQVVGIVLGDAAAGIGDGCQLPGVAVAVGNLVAVLIGLRSHLALAVVGILYTISVAVGKLF